MAYSKVLAVWAAASSLNVQGARVSPRQGTDISSKFIAGVPVLNYHAAYGGVPGASLAENANEHWVVVVKSGTSDAQIETMCKVSNGCERVGHPGAGGMPFLEIYASERILAKVLDTANGAAEFVEPDGTVALYPDIQEVQASSASWGLDRVGAPQRASEGKGVHVYVMDTGIRASHQDFTGRVVPTLEMTSQTLVECNGDVSCAGDIEGHGTHCAGIAAGATFGVAPKATIHSVKVVNDEGGGRWSWSYEALDWLATKGARPAVASISLGGPETYSAWQVAIETAVNARVTIVVAAGNEKSDACGFSPAFVPAAITVGSTNSADARSWFSNYGSCTDIWAPGSDITSASVSSDTGSHPYSGTSMACPHVSGAVALVLESNPDALSSGVLSSLLDRAEKGAISDLKAGDVNELLWVGGLGVTPYYVASGSRDCIESDRVLSESECRTASDALSYPYNKAVADRNRPVGCFADTNGYSYFNSLNNTSPTWTYGICKYA